MKSKRKSTKPVTLLTQIEALLSDALEELSSIEKSVEKNVRDLLVSAATSVAAAREFLTPALLTAPAHRTAATRRRTGRRPKRTRRTR